jgi:hypothetical protein
MKVESSDPVAEALGILRQAGEMPPMPMQGDSTFPGIAEDLGELFLAELRCRRERLAKWLELLHAEARMEGVRVRLALRSRHQCRSRAGLRGRRIARTR